MKINFKKYLDILLDKPRGNKKYNNGRFQCDRCHKKFNNIFTFTMKDNTELNVCEYCLFKKDN